MTADPQILIQEEMKLQISTVIQLIKEVITIELRIPTQPMSELLVVQIPEIVTTKVNSMIKGMKETNTEVTIIKAVRITEIEEVIETNNTISLETDRGIIEDNAATKRDKMTSPEIKNNMARSNKLVLVNMMEVMITAGNNARYVIKKVTIGC